MGLTNHELTLEIQQFHREVEQQEVDAYLNLQKSIELFSDINIPPEKQKIFNNAAHQFLVKIMTAKTAEEFHIYQDGFSTLLENQALLQNKLSFDELRIHNILSLHEDISKEINIHFFDLDVQKQNELKENLIFKFSKLREKVADNYFSQKLHELEFSQATMLASKENFEQNKQKYQDVLNNVIMKEEKIASFTSSKSFQQTALNSILQHNLNALSDARLSYLKESTSKKRMVIDALWITAGVGLTVASLAVPGENFVAATAIGAAVATYGIVDSAREIGEHVFEHSEKKLVPKREKLNALLQSHPSATPADQQALAEKSEKTGLIGRLKKIPKLFGAAGVFIAAALGVAGVCAFLFPPAAPFIMAGIALAATAVVMGVYVAGKVQERRAINQAKKEASVLLDETITQLQKPSEKPKPQLEPENQPLHDIRSAHNQIEDSTAKIEILFHGGDVEKAKHGLEEIHHSVSMEVAEELSIKPQPKHHEVEQSDHAILASEEEDEGGEGEGDGGIASEPDRMFHK